MDSAYSSDTIADNPSNARQQRSGSTLQLSDDIKTRSIEKTLLPLLSQINTLLTSRAGSQSPANTQGSSVRHAAVAHQHAARVGMLVAAAADKFVAVGESLAEEYPDAALEMREACNEVQTAALELRRLTDPSRQQLRCTSPPRGQSMSPGSTDSLYVVSTSRQLLSAITKVLLLADKLCVKQIMTARDRVFYCLQELENVSSRPTAVLAEFVATFSELGRALVELAHLSGDRQADLRQEKDRESLAVSRATLERGTQLLLAAAKTCLRHPESVAAARVRDSILRMMRQALNSVGQTLRETTDSAGPIIVPQSDSESSGATYDSGFPLGAPRNDQSEASPPLRDLVANVRSLVDGEALSLAAGSSAVQRLDGEVHRLADALQDFTDCAYTQHASRERLLGLLDRLRTETAQIAEQVRTPDGQNATDAEARGEAIRIAVNRLVDIITFLQSECQRTAEQLATAALDSRAPVPGRRGQISQSTPDMSEAGHQDDCSNIIGQLEYVALSGDQTAFHCSVASFEQRADLTIEAARLCRHVAPNDCLVLDAEHILGWLRLIGAAISASAQVLFEQFPNPVSRVSRESFRSFAAAWNDCTVRLLAQLKDRSVAAAVNSSVGNMKSQQLSPPLNASVTAGLFASPTSYSPPQMMSNLTATAMQNSPGNQFLSSSFCSAESLCANATPPNGFRPSSLPRGNAKAFGHGGGLFSQTSPLGGTAQTMNRSPGAFNVQNSPQFGTSSLVRRSGSQPSLLDHLRQLRRHADNLSAMDGAVAAFSTGNGPLNTTADLMLQAQFVAEQARTICRLSSIAATQLPNTNGVRDNVTSAVEKGLGATGRLEAVLAMPAPIVPATSSHNQQSAGANVKNERVIASCHAAVIAAGSVVNILLQSSTMLQSVPGSAIDAHPPSINPPLFSSAVNFAHSRGFSVEPRNFAAPVQYPGPEMIIGNGINRGRRPWYSRSAANLAPTGAHPLSFGDSPQLMPHQHRLM